MIFLADADFNVQIRSYIKGIISGNSADTLTAAEAMAIEEMTGYLAVKYDVEAIFSANGADRNPLIIMYCIDILLYHMHSNITPNDIPQIRMDRYDRAIKWLQEVSQDKLNPTLPLDESNTGSGGSITLGGDKKVTERW
jgi:phage gp36-like protein